MNKKYLLISLLLAIFLVGALILFREESKRLLLSLMPTKPKTSFIDALPFEKKKNNQRNRHKILLANLNSKQIYLDGIVITPRNAPRGTYIALALVVEFEDKKIAQKLGENKDFLRNIVVQKASDWDYLDFKSADGLQLIKKEILISFKKKLGSRVKSVYIAEYKFHRHKRL